MLDINNTTPKKLSITFKLDKSEMLENYPDIKYNKDIFVYEAMYGGIKFDIDGKYLENIKNTQCITDDHYVEEYLWFFYLDILESIIKLINKKNYVIGFADSTNSIKLKPSNECILFTFNYGNDIKTNLKDIPIKLNQYIEEVIKSSSEFINHLLKINPNVKESNEIKQLINKLTSVKTQINSTSNIKS